jgi:hypothetical protein
MVKTFFFNVKGNAIQCERDFSHQNFILLVKGGHRAKEPVYFGYLFNLCYLRTKERQHDETISGFITAHP